MKKICLWCRKTYKTSRRNQKYCDPKCQAKAMSRDRKGQHTSPSTEFKKGNIPQCPIKKNEHRSRVTEFKKGHSWLPTIKKKMLEGIRVAADKKRDPDNRPTTTCPTCHKPFSDFKSNNRRFCSRRCYEKFPKTQDTLIKMGKNHRSMKGPLSPSWKGGPVLINCEICGKEKYFIRSEVENGRGRFCSNKCKGVWNGRILKGKSRTPDQVRNSLRRRTPSRLEEKFSAIIEKHSLPYRYVGNGAFFIEQFNPDFINTNREKVAIEVYAKFYKELDGKSEAAWKRKRSRVFAKYGWSVIYFEAKEVNEDRVLSKLKGGPPFPS